MKNHHGPVLAFAANVALCGWLGPLRAESFLESFDADPTPHGWRPIGHTNLFEWNRTAGELSVTWDSSRSNSFFAYPLPSTLTKEDDFSFAFDLVLDSHAIGVNPARPSTFQIAAGFVRLADVTAANYVRGIAPGPRNTVEWAWFGAGGAISASVSPAIIPSNGGFPWGYADSYLSLETGVRYRFELAYTATNRTARLSMTADGQPGPALSSVVLPSNFTDFAIDAFAISSYSEVGQHPLYGGSVLATGRIDNVALTYPDAPVGRIEFLDATAARFTGRSGWRYQLEASGDLRIWTAIASQTATADGEVTLYDTRDAFFAVQFYRVKAVRP
jgi:hypothetical protein